MTAQERKITSYEIDPNGIIFVKTDSVIVDESGTVTHAGMTHRFPIQPGDAVPKGAPAEVSGLVKLFHTPAKIKAHQALMAKALKPAGKRAGRD